MSLPVNVIALIQDAGPLSRHQIKHTFAGGRTIDNIIQRSLARNYIKRTVRPFCRTTAYEITELGRAYVAHHLGE